MTSKSQTTNPKHIILDIQQQQPHPKITRIIPFTIVNRPNQTRKEKPRTLHRLSLHFQNQHFIAQQPSTFRSCFLTLMSSLKQLKSLTHLEIDLSLLTQHKSGQKISKFIDSLRHLKNLSLLRLHVSQDLIPLGNTKMLGYFCRALNEIRELHDMQIKLSLRKSSSRLYHSEFEKIISSLSQVKRANYNYAYPHKKIIFFSHIIELIQLHISMEYLSRLTSIYEDMIFWVFYPKNDLGKKFRKTSPNQPHTLPTYFNMLI